MNLLIEHIVSLLNTSVVTPRGIKSVYKGDPILIPVTNMPCAIVSPVTTAVGLVDTIKDQDTQTIAISVVLDARTYFNSSPDKTAGLLELANIMEERDTVTRQVLPDTVLGVIRKNLFADGVFSLDTPNVSINYGFADKRDYPTVEAVLTFDLKGVVYTR